MHPTGDIGIWVGAFLTIGILSFLYRDNPFYKFCESVFIGVSAGYWFVYAYHSNLQPLLIHQLGQGHWLALIPGVLGVLLLARLVPKVGWISRWSLAYIMGVAAGLGVIVYVQSNALEQLAGTVIPLTTFNNVVLVVGVLTGLVYFFFSKEHKGAFGAAARVGIWFLMVSFGASFGYTVMARISLLIGRMNYLFADWLGMI
jgi:hypothetical protein